MTDLLFITMTTVLSQKGQIVLPGTVREQVHLEPGQDFEVFIDDEDTLLLRRVSHTSVVKLVTHNPPRKPWADRPLFEGIELARPSGDFEVEY